MGTSEEILKGHNDIHAPQEDCGIGNTTVIRKQFKNKSGQMVCDYYRCGHKHRKVQRTISKTFFL